MFIKKYNHLFYQIIPAFLKSKSPETRAFKGTFYITKKSCTDWGNPTKKNIF